MSANPNTRAIDNSVEQYGGVVWNRLHSEREDICEALIKEPLPGCEASEAQRTANWHKELLQARLRKIDDALDRLMAGSYGHCSKCGRWIEDTKLAFDPAIAFCIECWEREVNNLRSDHLAGSATQNGGQVTSTCHSVDQASQTNISDEVNLASLSPFDTIRVQTLNSDYRIFLLDPKTGRGLVEGGLHFVEPVEAMVCGSTSRNFIFKGEIVIGLRIEMRVNGKLVSTSPVQSVRVEHCASAEPAWAGVSSLEM